MDAKLQKKIERVCELAQRRGAIVAELQEIDNELAGLCGDQDGQRSPLLVPHLVQGDATRCQECGRTNYNHRKDCSRRTKFSYICENGHRFRSADKKIDAVCPDCSSIHVQDDAAPPGRACGCGPRGPHREGCKEK